MIRGNAVGMENNIEIGTGRKDKSSECVGGGGGRWGRRFRAEGKTIE